MRLLKGENHESCMHQVPTRNTIIRYYRRTKYIRAHEMQGGLRRREGGEQNGKLLRGMYVITVHYEHTPTETLPTGCQCLSSVRDPFRTALSLNAAQAWPRSAHGNLPGTLLH